MATTKKYVSLEKLGLYDEKIKKVITDGDAASLASAKEYANGLASNYDVAGAAATAKSEAIAAAKTETETQVKALADGQVKTNKEAIEAIKDDDNIDSFADVVAELAKKQDTGDYATKTEAQGYANAKDSAISTAQAAAEAAQAKADANETAINNINNTESGILAQAKSHTNTEVGKVQTAVDTLGGKVGTVPEGSTVMGIITNIQENAYDDTAITERIDGIEEDVDTLIGTDTGKSVRTIANEELAKQLIAEGADASLDSLQEIAAWIQSHPNDASAMNDAIVALQNQLKDIDAGEGTVKKYVDDAITALKIGEYAKAADLTELAGRVTTLEGASVTHATKDELKAVSDSLDEYKTAHTGDYTNTQIDNAISGAISTERQSINAELDKKVDKVDGYGLSKNDLSDALKVNYDTAYTHSQTAHAPANAQANVIETVKVNGTGLTITDKAVDITVPTDNAELTNGAGYLVANDIANKADKATTLAGYGITDTYTSAQTDTAIANAVGQFVECSEDEINALFA